MVAVLITLTLCCFVAALGFRRYGRTTGSLIMSILLGGLGLIFFAAAIGFGLA